jgi:hypothetical protein
MEHLLDGMVPGIGFEWRPAGEQLVEDRPQRVYVYGRADVADPAGRLLGSHVPGRAQHGPILRPGSALAIEPLSEAEVGDLGTEVRGRRRTIAFF